MEDFMNAHWAPALTLTLMAVLAAAFPSPSLADDQRAREIMQKVEDRDEGDNMAAELDMTLIGKTGGQRLRRIKSFTKFMGKDRYRLMFFLHPADVKDTGFLTYDYRDQTKSDDQWLYMPALRKSKRIATEDKSGSFMGSDFTYFDMTRRNTEDYEYKLIKEEMVEGQKTWVIESVPKRQELADESGYTKTVSFVRRDNYVIVRGVNWMKEAGKLRYLEIKDLKLIDGVWTSLEIQMTTKSGEAMLHKTILRLKDVKYNQRLDENMFTVRALEKGL
jgi:hypothetical protein